MIVWEPPLSEAGEKAALNKFLNRFLAVNDDPQVRSLAIAALRRSAPDDERDLAERAARLQAAWGKDLPFVTRSALFVVGPATSSAACAGLTHADDLACASSFRDWPERQDDVNAEP